MLLQHAWLQEGTQARTIKIHDDPLALVAVE